jgi:hypothetical protein
MDIQPQNQQPISDDQELAKVLAGVNQQADEPEVAIPPLPEPPVPAEPPVMSLPDPITMPDPIAEPAAEPEVQMPSLASDLANESLDTIKQDAITELRPLIDKLDVSPEEKFDTYLLLLRSTDDQALVGPAHEAAKGITDEARRAQALLDIIKEIDFFSNKSQ